MRGIAIGIVGVVCGAAVCGGWARDSAACSTPVYRVAMYDWAPAQYIFVYFHKDKVPEADAKLHKSIAEAGARVGANVTLRMLDVGKEGVFKDVPDEVKRVWEERSSKDDATPIFAVFGPWGKVLHRGRLAPAELAKMLDSPARQRVCELLGQGNASVMLLLPGADAAKNEVAEKAIREVAADVEAGKIAGADTGATPPAAGLVPPAERAPPGAAGDRPPEKLKVATITVRRDDPEEAWLVSSLTSVEEDLEERAAEPMVFLVFGRGRALPPFVGKGITKENLAEGVTFLASSCSCNVRDQCPGFDMLTSWDWKTTAEALAAKDPGLVGGMEPYYQELVPAGTSPGNPSDEGRRSTPIEVAAPAAPAEAKTPVAEGTPSIEAVAPAAAEPASPTAPAAVESYGTRQAMHLGIGIGLAAIVVLVAGMVLMRRH